MQNLSGIVQQLKKERSRASQEIQRLDAAIASLGSVSSNGSTRLRAMSASGRQRISLAQKARWARKRAGRQPARTERTISAAARRRMAAAQRARWAKVKGQKKTA